MKNDDSKIQLGAYYRTLEPLTVEGNFFPANHIWRCTFIHDDGSFMMGALTPDYSFTMISFSDAIIDGNLFEPSDPVPNPIGLKFTVDVKLDDDEKPSAHCTIANSDCAIDYIHGFAADFIEVQSSPEDIQCMSDMLVSYLHSHGTSTPEPMIVYPKMMDAIILYFGMFYGLIPFHEFFSMMSQRKGLAGLPIKTLH